MCDSPAAPGRVLSAPNASCGSADRHIADAAAGGRERLMGREGAFANVGLRSRSDQMHSARRRQWQSRAVAPPSIETRWARGTVELCCIRCSPIRRSQRVASVLCAGPPREKLVLRSSSAISDAAWVLEVSNIYPATKKALHLCKALIFLVFLAPRPGLEPGTYGLTGWASIGPLARMNARFSGFAFPILLGSFAQQMPRMCLNRPLDIGSVHR